MFISPDNTNNGIFSKSIGFVDIAGDAKNNPIDMLPAVLANADTSFSSIAAINTAFNLVNDPSAMSAFTSSMQMMGGMQNFFSPFGMQSPMGNSLNPFENSFNPLQAENAEYEETGDGEEAEYAEDMEE